MQILAYESDLLAFGDIFNGNPEIEKKTQELVDSAWAEIQEVLGRGGAVEAVESGYIKQKLVESNAARLRRIEAGEQIVVGVNKFIEGTDSPLVENLDEAILTVDPAIEGNQKAALDEWRAQRDNDAVKKALVELKTRCGHRRKYHAGVDRSGACGRHYR